MFVEVIASQSSVVFWVTVYIVLNSNITDDLKWLFKVTSSGHLKVLRKDVAYIK